jgi:large subunit ribosomal protein L35
MRNRQRKKVKMPKLKTNRGARKRFRITGSGKIRRNHAGMNHILTKKTTKRKRKLRKSGPVESPDFRRVRRMITS